MGFWRDLLRSVYRGAAAGAQAEGLRVVGDRVHLPIAELEEEFMEELDALEFLKPEEKAAIARMLRERFLELRTKLRGGLHLTL